MFFKISPKISIWSKKNFWIEKLQSKTIVFLEIIGKIDIDADGELDEGELEQWIRESVATNFERFFRNILSSKSYWVRLRGQIPA